MLCVVNRLYFSGVMSALSLVQEISFVPFNFQDSIARTIWNHVTKRLDLLITKGHLLDDDSAHEMHPSMYLNSFALLVVHFLSKQKDQDGVWRRNCFRR